MSPLAVLVVVALLVSAAALIVWGVALLSGAAALIVAGVLVAGGAVLLMIDDGTGPPT